MRILHTSDWHLGRTLYGRRRQAEYAAFLEWLIATLERQRVDALLIAGDVFDTGTPGNASRELYYRFLYRAVSSTPCRRIVLTAGNHDSPSFLAAPRDLLGLFNIHVIGAASENPDDEIVELRAADGVLEAVVCAVPYLRDSDMRLVEAGESAEDKSHKLLEGMREHYAAVARAALRRCDASAAAGVPIIGMGHLFASGGTVLEGDGVRDLYVGGQAHVNADTFSDAFSYLALGHLHMPQTVGGSAFRRYSGSPLPMTFAEAGRAKSVCLLELPRSDVPDVRLLSVPCFQELISIAGNWQDMEEAIRRLADARSTAWLDVIYDGSEHIADLRERVEILVRGSGLEIVRIRNNRIAAQALARRNEEQPGDLDAREVFERCLDAHAVPREQRPALVDAYREILDELASNMADMPGMPDLPDLADTTDTAEATAGQP
jgi:exonuclease SbcD